MDGSEINMGRELILILVHLSLNEWSLARQQDAYTYICVCVCLGMCVIILECLILYIIYIKESIDWCDGPTRSI